MAWYETLADTVGKLIQTDPESGRNLLDYISSSNEQVSTVNSLLMQVQRDPSSASAVATEIISMRGLPQVVKDLASNLPQAAKDGSGTTLIFTISQIQSALPRSRWF